MSYGHSLSFDTYPRVLLCLLSNKMMVSHSLYVCGIRIQVQIVLQFVYTPELQPQPGTPMKILEYELHLRPTIVDSIRIDN